MDNTSISTFLYSIFLGSYDKKIHCVSTAYGTPIWTHQHSAGSIFATPIFYSNDNSLLTATLDGSIIKLIVPSLHDVKTSEHEHTFVDVCSPIPSEEHPKEVWDKNVKFPVFSTPIIASLNHNLTIALVINVKGDIFIFDYMNAGQLLWQQTVNANVFSSPILLPSIENQVPSYRIVFGTHEKCLYNLAISTVEPKTQFSKTSDGNILNKNNQLNCNFEWKAPHSEKIYATPYAFYGDTSCTCHICQHYQSFQQTDIYHLEMTTTITNTHEKRGIIENSMTDKSLYIASISTDGFLNIICAKSGIILAQHKLGNNIFSSPVIVNNRLVIGNRDNFLTCFGFDTS